jgi:hypothetical protein
VEASLIDKGQLRSLIDRTLRTMDLYSPAASNLLMGTAAQESRLGTYLRQLNGGPALGIFQMEPNTHGDIWRNYLEHRPELKKTVSAYLSWRHVGVGEAFFAEELEWNLAYAIAMARVHYLRVPERLPMAGHLTGLARYWKHHYNTPLGAGTEQEFIDNYRRYCI